MDITKFSTDELKILCKEIKKELNLRKNELGEIITKLKRSSSGFILCNEGTYSSFTNIIGVIGENIIHMNMYLPNPQSNSDTKIVYKYLNNILPIDKKETLDIFYTPLPLGAGLVCNLESNDIHLYIFSKDGSNLFIFDTARYRINIDTCNVNHVQFYVDSKVYDYSNSFSWVDSNEQLKPNIFSGKISACLQQYDSGYVNIYYYFNSSESVSLYELTRGTRIFINPFRISNRDKEIIGILLLNYLESKGKLLLEPHNIAKWDNSIIDDILSGKISHVDFDDITFKLTHKFETTSDIHNIKKVMMSSIPLNYISY